MPGWRHAPDPAAIPRDVGLAGERTDLSWGRTLLAVLALSSVFLRWLPSQGFTALLPVIAGLVTAGGLARLRHRRRREVLAEHGSAAEEVVGLTALCLVVGAVALGIIVTS
ncbi:MAG: DUF202 domain-containing protein [Tetrasphaera sp.]